VELFSPLGYFFVMPGVEIRPLTELFRGHVLKMLKKEGLIDDTFIKMTNQTLPNLDVSILKVLKFKSIKASIWPLSTSQAY